MIRRILVMFICCVLLVGANFADYFDPADFAVLTIEKVDGNPFAAKIRNRLNGRSYDFVLGDELGPTKIVEMTDDHVVLEDRLTKHQYHLPVPIGKLEEKMVQKEREEFRVKYDEARRLFRIGKGRSAVEMLKNVLEINPGYMDAHFLLAIIYHENHLYKDAFLHYKEVVTIDPKNHRAYYNIAQIFTETANFKEALYYVRKALYIQPDYEKALNLYAQVQDELEQLAKREGTLQSVEEREKQKMKVQADMQRVGGEVQELTAQVDELKAKKKPDGKDKERLKNLQEQLNVKQRLYDYQSKQLKKLLDE